MPYFMSRSFNNHLRLCKQTVWKEIAKSPKERFTVRDGKRSVCKFHLLPSTCQCKPCRGGGGGGFDGEIHPLSRGRFDRVPLLGGRGGFFFFGRETGTKFQRGNIASKL